MQETSIIFNISFKFVTKYLHSCDLTKLNTLFFALLHFFMSFKHLFLILHTLFNTQFVQRLVILQIHLLQFALTKEDTVRQTRMFVLSFLNS